MKRLMAKTLAVLTAASTFAVAFAPSDAEARRYWRPRVGVYIGAPVLPYYYYPRPYYNPYYYQPPVVVQEAPVTYIEQYPPVAATPAPQAQPQQQQFWFFCQDSQTYYPHAQTCASPWQRVMPHATPQQPQGETP